MKTKYIIGGSLLAVVLLAALIGARYYRTWQRPNVVGEERVCLKIYADDGFDRVMAQLREKQALRDYAGFERAARREGYTEAVRSGYYELDPGLGNKAVVRILKQGLQTPVRISFNNIRKFEQLAGRLASQLMLDSATLYATFTDTAWQRQRGFDSETARSFFLPDTYEVWWNCSPERLMQTFGNAYDRFWTAERVAQAKAQGLTPPQVAIIASIIEDESNKKDEWPQIASLYLNRLRRRIPMQACPTIKYAMDDFTIRRVLKEYMETESPYNTYKHRGLPPGPIRIPGKAAQEAVLHAPKTNYLYMCARDDFSGYHYFSSSLSQHNMYANRYHQALNRRKIYH